MRILRRALLLGALASVPALPALAADSYLPGGTLDLGALIAPPPAAGSAAELADMRAIVAAQAAADAARLALAQADYNEDGFYIFAPVLGAGFNAAALPRTAALLRTLTADASHANAAAKKFFGRPRPATAYPDQVKVVRKSEKNGSYPSGHTTRVTVAAIVLAAMLPERRAAIWARAAEYAQSRIIAGAHYPSDIAAGWRGGTALAAVAMAQPGFRADRAAAQAELRVALGLPETPATSRN